MAVINDSHNSVMAVEVINITTPKRLLSLKKFREILRNERTRMRFRIHTHKNNPQTTYNSTDVYKYVIPLIRLFTHTLKRLEPAPYSLSVSCRCLLADDTNFMPVLDFVLFYRDVSLATT